MTLNELLRNNNGEWQGDNAVIVADGGYYWVVAMKVDGKVKITSEGRRFGLGDVSASDEKPAQYPPGDIANVSENKVESVPKKRGRKPAHLVDDLGLDDL